MISTMPTVNYSIESAKPRQLDSLSSKAIPAIIGFFVLCTCCCSSSFAQERALAQCPSVDLGGNLRAISTAVWSPDDSAVIVTDPVTPQVVLLSNRGAETRPLKIKGLSVGQKPYAGIRIGDLYGQIVSGFTVFWFDRQLNQLSGSTTLFPANVDAVGSGHELKLITDWAWSAKDAYMLAYGGAARASSGVPDSQPLHGFYSYLLASPVSKATVARGVVVNREVSLVLLNGKYDFHFLGYPFIAATNDAFYFIAMEFFPALFRYTPEDKVPSYIEGLPGEGDSLPVFNTDFSNRREIYKKIEGFSMPMGLYSFGEFLYLLYREAADQGTEDGTSWWLFKMKPGLDEVELLGKPFLIPSQAKHLTILPGTGHWIVFEKSSVSAEDNKSQEIKKALLIPASLIEETGECSPKAQQ